MLDQIKIRTVAEEEEEPHLLLLTIHLGSPFNILQHLAEFIITLGFKKERKQEPDAVIPASAMILRGRLNFPCRTCGHSCGLLTNLQLSPTPLALSITSLMKITFYQVLLSFFRFVTTQASRGLSSDQ